MPPSSNWTDRDMQLLRCAFLAQRDPNSFKAKFAELAGFKTPASATTSWLIVKKKIMATNASENAEEGETSASAPKKPRARKTKAATDTEEGENAGEGEESKPTTKRSRKNEPAGGARKRAKTVATATEEGDNGPSSPASAAIKEEEDGQADDDAI